MRISVVIPVKDDQPGLDETLRAVAALGPVAADEVIVCDNGSDPPMAVSAGVRLVRETRPGSYAARNAGVGVSSGGLLAFTDAGCRPTSAWLAAGAAALADHTLDAVGGPVVLTFRDGLGPTTPAERFESERAFPQQTYIRDEGFAVTANLVLTRAAFEAAGGFDPRARSGGDLDFGRRLAAAGQRLGYAADAVVRHPARTELRELWSKGQRVSRGVRRLEQAGLRSGSPRRRLLPGQCVTGLRSIASALFRRPDLGWRARIDLATGVAVWQAAVIWASAQPHPKRQEGSPA
ncbi:MAG: glycosyltransferase [Propionibacteriaceae bacterium]